MACKNCNTEVKGTPNYCKNCGVPLADHWNTTTTIKNHHNGAENSAGTKLCNRDADTFNGKPEAAQPGKSAPSDLFLSITPSHQRGSIPNKDPSVVPDSIPNNMVPLITGIIVALLLVGGLSGYLYWAKKNTGESAAVKAGSNSVSILQGKSQRNRPEKNERHVTELSANNVVFNPAVMENAINQQLLAANLSSVVARVDDRRHVFLYGTVASNAAKDKAKEIAQGQKLVVVVDSNGIEIVSSKERLAVTPVVSIPSSLPQQIAITPSASPPVLLDPAKLEGEIGRTLRTKGISGISAQVGDDLTVTLKGSATSMAEKELAFSIARQFDGVEGIKDKIFVIE